MPVESFSATFRAASSEEEDDDDPIGLGICRLDSSTTMPSGHGCGSSGHSPAFSSTPLLHRGHFFLTSDQKEVPSSSLSTPPLEGDELETWPVDEDLDTGLDTGNKGDGDREPGECDDCIINAVEVEILKGIINVGTPEQAPILPKSGEK